MDAALFRPQAVDARRRADLGAPLERSPLGARATASVAIIIVCGIALLACTIEVPRRATVRGYLAPERGVVRVRPAAPGVVAELAVREGDEVVAGQALLTLAMPRSTPAVADVARRDATDRAALRAELVAQRQLVQSGLEAELAALERRRAALGRELAALTAQLEVARQRVGWAERRLAELAPATAQGLLPAAQLLQQRDRAGELTLEALRLEQQVLELGRELAALDAERGTRGRQARLRVAELDAALARQSLEALDAEQRHDSVVRAPTAGRVLRIAARPGAMLSIGQTALVLAPTDAPLRAVLLVPTRDAGMLSAGQPVVMRLDAFPYQRYGTQRATVLAVGASVLLPGEAELPLAFDEPVFEVRAALADEAIEAHGRHWPLRTDLTFEADIVLERATLIERLLDPLRAVTRRAS
jgi:membrane fusion protein